MRAARRREDGRRVRIKVTRRDFPRPEELAQLRHELGLLQQLAEAPIAHALELVRVGNGLGLVLEDAGEESFDRVFPSGATSLELWLRLAIGAAHALEAVHARGVLHKDIKPQHFFFTDNEVRDYDDARAQDSWRYPPFFHALLDNGVYPPPSVFEAWFVSAAHDDAALDRIATALPLAARAAAHAAQPNSGVIA